MFICYQSEKHLMITFSLVATVLIIGLIVLVGNEVRGLPANVVPAKVVQSYVNGEFDIIINIVLNMQQTNQIQYKI
jgi:hypothetical protein